MKVKKLALLVCGFIAFSIISRANNIQTYTLKKTIIKIYSEVPAFVISKNTVVVSSKLMGFVEDLKVDVGDKVKKGEILLKIDSKSIKEKIKQAKANLENASFNFHKIKKLYKEKVVPKKSFIAAKSAYEQAKAALKDLETLIGYSIVRSPINGFVAKRMVQNGDLAAPSQPLLVLEGIKIYQVQTNVPDQLFPKIIRMKKIPIKVENRTILGFLQYAQKSEDPISHTHLVKLAIHNYSFVHPGEFARVLIEREKQKTITVPESAVTIRGNIKGVFVVKNGRAYFRIVRLGEKIKNSYIVLSGLNTGEKVILNPPYNLENGSKVQ